MHFDHARRAISAGKHVMVEKPVTLDLPQARQWRSRRRRRTGCSASSTIAAGTSTISPCGTRCSRAASDGSSTSKAGWGNGRAASARRHKEYRPGWRNEAEFGGGGLYDWGSHFIDQIWRLLYPAKPVRVFAQLRGNVWTRDCDDFARVLIDFDSGAVGLVEINTTTTRPLPRWHLDGLAGSADSPHSLTFDLDTWASSSSPQPAAGRRKCSPRRRPELSGRSGSNSPARSGPTALRRCRSNRCCRRWHCSTPHARAAARGGRSRWGMRCRGCTKDDVRGTIQGSVRESQAGIQEKRGVCMRRFVANAASASRTSRALAALRGETTHQAAGITSRVRGRWP